MTHKEKQNCSKEYKPLSCKGLPTWPPHQNPLPWCLPPVRLKKIRKKRTV
jgi:hypothetical protein